MEMAADMHSLIRATMYYISTISVASLPSTIFFTAAVEFLHPVAL